MTSPSSPTPTPTPIELLYALWHEDGGYEARRAHFDELLAFLSTPAVKDLADPALRAAAEAFNEAIANPAESDLVMALGFAMAEVAGEDEDTLNQLIWQGNPPEPWETVSDKYRYAASELFNCAMNHLVSIQKAWDEAAQAAKAKGEGA